MASLYTPKRICDTLGITQSALRIYCDKYAGHLSQEATTTPRKFWEDDLRTLAFFISKTKEGRSHDQVLDLLNKDEGKVELQEFKEEWEATEQPTGHRRGSGAAAGVTGIKGQAERLYCIRAES